MPHRPALPLKRLILTAAVSFSFLPFTEAQEARFYRGEVDQAGGIDLTDAVSILRHLFAGELEPACLDAADMDDTGVLELTDGVYLLNHLFRGGPPPAEPFADCGYDPTLDTLSCAGFPACPSEPPGLDSRPPNLGCAVLERPPFDSPVIVSQVFPSLPLSGIVNLHQPPGDSSRWYAVRRSGYIYSFPNQDAANRRTTVLDFSGRIATPPSEGGLVSLAFHPNFPAMGKVFLFYTTPGPPITVHISRFTSPDGGETIDPASEEVLITVEQPSIYHHGGHLAFGPDRYLYVGFGDGGRKSTAQDPDDLLGSMARIDVDGGSPYGIPPDNPFAAGGGRPEIFAWGIRQPWRWSFDRATGDLWVGDVGNTDWEEVDRIVNGGNYGWPVREGTHCQAAQEECDVPSLIDPIAEYSHLEGNCIIGGYVYRGSSIPELDGVYIYGDWGAGKVWGLFPGAGGKPAPRILAETGAKIVSFAQDHEGEVYVIEGTKLFKIAKAPETDPAAFPAKLSLTGYVDPAAPASPAPCMIPYEINVPFWSDTAVKERWLLLPDGERIEVGADGDWEFPPGTVFMKSFRVEGKLIETRLLMRHADGEWGGYSYEWDDAETDATLLPDEKMKMVGSVPWSYPSRSQCLQCHTSAAGRVLGLETPQLNRAMAYASTGRVASQLRTLEHIGLFAAPLPGAPESLPSFPDIADEAVPLETRARAYLHANCSHCHRPGGAGRGPTDFRFQVPPLLMNICNATPSAEDLGVPGARILYPGDPSRSVISLRMHAADNTRMPPIGRNVVDAPGAALIDAWITAWAFCDPAEASSVILDNGQPGTSFLGNWSISDAPNPYGPDSWYSRQDGAVYTYDVTLPQAGAYDVYLWWTEWPSRWNAVPVEIDTAAGTAAAAVNQQENGGKWNWIGRWDFGAAGTVRIYSQGLGSVSADAVRFTPTSPPQ